MQTIRSGRSLGIPSAAPHLTSAAKAAPAVKPAVQAPVAALTPQPEAAALKVAVPVDQWIKLSGFSPLNQEQTLQGVLSAVKSAMAAYARNGGLRPMIIFDLDDTLTITAARTMAILKEWLAATEMPKDIHDKLASLDKTLYENADTFAKAGLDLKDPQVKALFDQFNKFWKGRFFSNEYLKFDTAQAGGLDYVKAVLALGADVAYVTGRDEPNMGDGTRASLKALGFPVPGRRPDPSAPQVSLHLKDAFADPDAPFKFKVAQELSKTNNVIGTFDNSPGNVVALKDALPNGMNVFVNTVYGKGPYELRNGLYKVDGFSRV